MTVQELDPASSRESRDLESDHGVEPRPPAEGHDFQSTCLECGRPRPWLIDTAHCYIEFRLEPGAHLDDEVFCAPWRETQHDLEHARRG